MRIALVGMYGGMWREYNPGCYLTGEKTYFELKKRLPKGTDIELFSIDNRMEARTDKVRIAKENKHGLEISFFSREDQLEILDDVLSKYDALVFGGDIIWGGDDVVEDNDIFFLKSESFLNTAKPKVLFNSVHTFYQDLSEKEELFWNACRRASYISVRSRAVKERLENIADKDVHLVPDVVLDMEIRKRYRMEKYQGNRIGISIRNRLSEELADALREMRLPGEICLFPYSRQYDNLATVEAVKRQFGDRFRYLEEYASPSESFRTIGEFDLLINDTYHGIIAAIIQDVPFISVDLEDETASRKDQLLEYLGINKARNVRLKYGDPGNADRLAKAVEEMSRWKHPIDKDKLAYAKTEIQQHFDRMAEIILDN